MFYRNHKSILSILLSLFAILSIQVTSYADITPVSDRTAEVRDTIVTAAGVNTADEVTETHLATITSLNLRNAGISELKTGDFSGMTGLTSLNLYNNQLSSLPDGIFEGLTALTSLRLGGNTVDPLPITITLEKSEDGQFKAIVPTGAPFDIVIPISASNGSVADSATSLTITKGSTESSAVTVSRTADTTAAVTANIGTLPGLPRNHYGYVLTKSDVLPLEVISAVTTTPPPVEPPVEPPIEPPVEPPTNTAPVFTDGSTAIRSIAENTAAETNIGTAVSATDANEDDTLTYALSGVDAASFDIEQTTGQLKTKASLDYEMKRVYIVAISVSDSTLTDTITVIISVIDVDDTPFVSTTLAVSNRTPEVRDAIVNAVPGVSSANEVTDTQLAAITSLSLRVAGITELKSGDFSGLTGLTSLNLYGNMLNTLPIGIFEGLTSLTTLRLGGNLVDPLPLIVSLQQIDAGEFQAVVHTAAPFDIVLPIGVMMVTIPKGSLTSAPFTDTSTPSIGALPGLPENHFGYILAKSTVYNRTPQVRDAIVAALSDVNNYRNVTEADLATITTLNLDGKSITSLKAGDFAGMLSLTTLNLSNNQLTSLPDNIFVGLVSLTELNLSGNSVLPLQLTVSLQKVGEKQIKAVAPAGAPFDIIMPINVANGNINGTTLTIPTGNVESESLTVTRTSGTTAAVTVDIATLPSPLSGHTGYALVKSNQQPLEVFEDINIAPVFIEGTSTTRTITENSEVGVDIGSAVSATDANNDTLTYSLSGTDATSFDIDPSIGQLKTKTDLDFETKFTYSVSITASDGLLTDTITVTINVSDIDEDAPVDNVVGTKDDETQNNTPEFIEGSTATRSAAENTGSGVDIGTAVSATDTDKDTLTYSLDGTDADSFSINSTNGQIRTSAALDYETKSSYSVTITVSDGNNGSDTITVTITVTDVEERLTNSAPEFTDGESVSLSVAENTGSGVNIGDAISATDPDNDTLTYSFDGTDADSFSINSTNGQLRTNAALDYETKASYSVTITVSDGNNGSDTITVTITVTDVEERLTNSAPEFTDGESVSLSVAENTGSGVNIGDAISATDPDNDTLTYSLGGTDADSFSINSTNGQLRTNAALDYETKVSYSVTITVSDGNNGNDTITVTITVTDVEESLANNAPEFTDGSSTTRTVAENTGSGVNIGDAVSATDADDDTLTYSLSGTDSSSFSINSTNGQLRTNAALDYETKASYSVTITVSDGYNGSDTITVTITVTDVDETPANNDPVFTETSPATRSIAENTTSGVNIGSAVSATDADNDTLTYGLTGTDASVFSIDNSNGQLQTSAPLDYETKSSYLVTVNVSDVNGGSDTITVTINITDANDAPVFADGVSASRTIPENTGANINIGRVLAATDADDDTLTYSLGGTDAASFNIDTSSGQLKTKTTLDYETKTSYTVTASVTDGESGSDTITVTINVRDLDETPSNIAPVFTEGTTATRTIAENTAADTDIGTPIAVTDADSETLAYVLSGTDASSFSIDDETGQLKTSGALNYETKDSYTVTVTVSDGSQNDTITVTINVTNANDAPVFAATNDTALTIAENTAAGTNIGAAFTATDEDGDTLAYSLGGTDAASYDIDSESGQLKTKSALDFETKPSYSVEIVVSDGKNGSDTLEVGITVTNVDENRAPVFTEGEEATRSVAENTGSGIDIGTAVGATDADADDILEYALRGTDASKFSIDSTSGLLRTSAALDYETKISYSVRIRVSDGNNGVARIDVTINVIDVAENSAPVFEDGEETTRSVAENTGSGLDIGTAVGATDADTDTLVYSLGGTDNTSFSIDSTSGQLRTKDALDYETKSSYSVSITVTDGNEGSDTITVTINVTDIVENRAPVFTDTKPTTRSVAENTGTGLDIGTAVGATDADTDTLVYSLGGTDNTSFSIDSTSGQLRTKDALDYETKSSYSVSITVTDGNEGSDTITVTINVTDVVENRAPVFTDTKPTTRSVAENTGTGLDFGAKVEATDADTADTLVYSLSGTDANKFSIDSTAGQLRTLAALDYEDKKTYSVTITVSDGSLEDEITVTINVTDANDAPEFTNGTNTTRSVAENTAANTNIGNAIAATDPDNDTLTYSLGGTNAAAFSIDTGSGQLKTKAALDYEMKTRYSVTVSVSDGNGGNDSITVKINVSDDSMEAIITTLTGTDRDENSAPTFFSTFFSSSFSYRINIRNASDGDNIGTPIIATDADGDTLTYSVGGDDASFFSIVSVNGLGQLKVTQALIDDTNTTYSINVIADDGNGGTAEIAGTVIASGRISTQVTNNTPVFTDSNPTTRSIAENTASGQNIGDPVGATDADTGDILTYTLGGTDAASFDIVSTSGQLKTKTALDYETKISYTVTVTVTDNSGVASNNSATITVTINITDVYEDTSITPVSDRTREVRDAIVNKISGVSDPADVTAAHLAAITGTLNLSFKSIVSLSDGDFDGLTALGSIDFQYNPDLTSLPSGIFDGLTALRKIDLDACGLTSLPSGVFDGLTSLQELILYSNQLRSLPTGIFEDLTALQKLGLSGNFFKTIPSGILVNLTNLTTFYIDGNYDEYNEEDETYTLVGDLSLPVSLALVQSGVFKAVAPTGAPFDIAVPLSVINGSISGGATSITIPKGSVESASLTVTQDTGTTSAVAVNIGTLPSIPSDHDHDGYGLTKGGTLIVISGSNAAPVFNDDSSTTRTIEETNTSGLNIGSPVDAVDAENETLTYTLGGTDAASFSIVNTSGQLKTLVPLDHDTKSSYTVTVTATDTSGANNNSTTITVTINVSGRTSNNAPVFTVGTPARRSVVENTASGVNFDNPIRASDADRDILEYTLSGTDGDSFDIVSTTGRLQTKAPLDYETKSSYTVIVTVSDGFGGSDTITVTIDVLNVAEGTSITPVSDRTAAVRAAIVNAISGVSNPADVTASHLATITSLNLGNKSISSLSVGDFDGLLELRTLNLSSNDLTTLPIGIFDGLTSLTELNLYDNYMTTLPSGIFVNLTSLTTLYLDENLVDPLPLPINLELVQSGEFKAVAPTGAPFDIVVPISVTNGTISGGATSLTISKGSVESASLTVTRNSGSTASVYVSIGSLSSIPSTHDGYVLTKGGTFSVISGDNAAPVFNESGTVTRTIAEGNQPSRNIGSPVTATDSDNETLTYTLGGTDAASFSIDSTSGQLKTLVALNFETKSSYTVTVTVTDTSRASNNSTAITVTINVTYQLNHAPVFTDGETTSRSVLETATAGNNIGRRVAATDANNDVLEYTLSGTDAASFSIVSTSGQLQASATLDYDTKTSYSVTVSVSDSVGGSDTIDVTINVLDVVEGATTVSNRTAAVREAIVEAIDGVSDPADVTAAHLATITSLDLSYTYISSLSDGDFDGLTALTVLDIESISIHSLPRGIFDDLTALTSLDIDANSLSSLPSGIFDNLTSLTSLDLQRNSLTSLPSGIFDNLTSLTTLELNYNNISSLDSGIFRNLSKLDFLLLQGNKLRSLPNGLFEGLSSLSTLSLVNNDGATFRFTVSLVKGSGNTVKAVCPLGAPFDIFVGINIDNGRFSTSIISAKISVGSVESPEYTVNRTPGTTGDVVAYIRHLPVIPYADDGYVLVEGVSNLSVIKGENSAPEFTVGSTTTRSILEKTVAGVNIGNPVTATDTDEFDTLTYSLGGTDASSFSIDSGTGQLKTNTALDYDTKASYSVTVSVSDGFSGTDSIAVTISVIDFDDSAPSVALSDRTSAVSSAIVRAIPGVTTAADVKTGHIKVIRSLDLSSKLISSLLADDFDGLTNLETLNLYRNNLTLLPSDLFDGLTNLTTLSLELNDLTSIPSAIFDDLTSLRTLDLDGNKLTTLPENIFDNLTSLVGLQLQFNDINTLPGELFKELTNLDQLRLDHNELSTLPDGLLVVPRRLTTLNLSDNPTGTANGLFRIPVGILKITDGAFLAVCPPGAPIDIDMHPQIINGSLADHEERDGVGLPADLRIPGGSVTSNAVQVVPSGNSAISVDIYGIFWDGRQQFSHSGYELFIAESNLPLEVTPAVGGAPEITVQAPKVTEFLPNYPNPFNPETWIPYQLSKSSDVTLTIYNMRGVVVRKLDLGHKPAGYYTDRKRSAHWDGRNDIGEKVAAGVYFCTFKAGDYTATRKMMIRK